LYELGEYSPTEIVALADAALNIDRIVNQAVSEHSLNPHLINAPTDCIDYVQLHELCHLKCHNHGTAFHRLLQSHLPNWEAIKSRLDGMAAILLDE
jgi:predicted metal-dependent hydrolase